MFKEMKCRSSCLCINMMLLSYIIITSETWWTLQAFIASMKHHNKICMLVRILKMLWAKLSFLCTFFCNKLHLLLSCHITAIIPAKLSLHLNLMEVVSVDLLNSWARGGSSSTREPPWRRSWHSSRHTTLVQLRNDWVAHLLQFLLLVFVLIFLCRLWTEKEEKTSLKIKAWRFMR